MSFDSPTTAIHSSEDARKPGVFCLCELHTVNYTRIREVILRSSAPGPECSLAGVPAGSTAEIRSIVFGGIRQALAEAGVHEGDLVVCRPGAGNRVQLENDAGKLVEIAEGWARFIEVEALESAGFQIRGAAGSRSVGRGMDAPGRTPPNRSGAPVYPSGPGGGGQPANGSESRGKLTPPGTAT